MLQRRTSASFLGGESLDQQAPRLPPLPINTASTTNTNANANVNFFGSVPLPIPHALANASALNASVIVPPSIPKKRIYKQDLFQTSEAEPSSEIVASLPFQMCLYFNAIYSIPYWICMVIMFLMKLSIAALDALNIFLWVVLFAIWTVSEVSRIWSGWTGNLKEKVPHLIAFMFLTFFFALVIHIYDAILCIYIFPLERVLITGQLIFVVLEFFFGLIALRRIVRVSSFRYAMYFNKDGTLFVPSAQDSQEAGFAQLEMELKTARRKPASAALRKDQAAADTTLMEENPIQDAEEDDPEMELNLSVLKRATAARPPQPQPQEPADDEEDMPEPTSKPRKVKKSRKRETTSRRSKSAAIEQEEASEAAPAAAAAADTTAIDDIEDVEG